MQYKTLKKFATKAAQFTATLASAALLASTALVPEVSAFTLRKADDGRVIGIDALEVEGNVYNVDFIRGYFSEVFGDDYDLYFTSYSSALKALSAVTEALGDQEYISHYFDGATMTTKGLDSVWIPFTDGGSINGIKDDMWDVWDDRNFMGPSEGVDRRWYFGFWADFNLRVSDSGEELWGSEGDRGKEEPIMGTAVGTPEPSLILGLITISGLMLGSKRKTKG